MWNIDTCKMWSLGHFTVPPQETLLWITGFEFWLEERLRTRQRGLHVRSPEHVWSVSTSYRDGVFGNDSGDNWHQDGLPTGERYLGFWSNTFGTEIKVWGSKSDVIYQAEPCEFILMDNKFFEHRPPQITEVEAQDRWLIRCNVKGHVKKHPDVMECVL